MFNIVSFFALILPITAIPLNVGTALYSIDNVASKTWTTEDVAILRSRILMDQLIPKNVVGGRSFLKYVQIIVSKFETISNDQTRKIAMVTACDAIGAYLQGVMLPHVKDGYYKGHESYAVTNELFALERKIKFILDTDGRGWMTPVDVGQQSTAVVTGDAKNDDADYPIYEETENPCAALLTKVVRSDRGLITTVPVPTFDDNTNPGSLAFPFMVGNRLFPVNRPWLAADDRRPLLVRYYRLAVGCTSPAPKQFREDMHRWLDSVVMDAYTGSTKCTQSFDYADKVRSTIDWLDLPVDRKNTDVWFSRRRGLAKSFPSSPELTTDSPVYHSGVMIGSPPGPFAVLVTAEIDVDAETPKCLQRYGPSLIDSLDLAVDQRISAVGLRSLPRREHAVSFRSSVELSVHSPVYGTANTVPSVVAEILPNLARSERRRSLWKRSKRFVWKSMVNAARRICFCRSFVDLG
ncbi:hypothetical protein QTP88_003756 [Uroleucon formosanum]